MIQVYIEDKTVVIPAGMPLNIVYLELNNIWRTCNKEASDKLREAKIPMSFEADHELGIINYKFINQWKMVEVE